MKRLLTLLVLAAALTFGMALAEDHGGEPADAADTTTESSEGDAGQADDATEPAGDAAEGAAGDDATGDTDDAEVAGGGEADKGDDAAIEEVDLEDETLLPETAVAATHANEVAEFLASREDLSIFLMLLERAGMLDTLFDDDRAVTIFAPRDAAFASMDRLQFSTLVNDQEALRAMLERHIVLEEISSAELSSRLTGGALTASLEEQQAQALRDADAGEAVAVGEDVDVGEAAADAATDADADADVADADAEVDADMTAEADDEITVVAGAATPTGLDPDAVTPLSTLSGEQIDVGLRSSSDRGLDELDTADVAEADGVEGVAGGGAADDGRPFPIPGRIYVEDARVLEADASAGPATIHVIDAVLLPPMEEEEAE